MPQHLDRAFLRVRSPPFDRNSGARLGTKRSLFNDENTLLNRSATTSYIGLSPLFVIADYPRHGRVYSPRPAIAGMRVDRSS